MGSLTNQDAHSLVGVVPLGLLRAGFATPVFKNWRTGQHAIHLYDDAFTVTAWVSVLVFPDTFIAATRTTTRTELGGTAYHAFVGPSDDIFVEPPNVLAGMLKPFTAGLGKLPQLQAMMMRYVDLHLGLMPGVPRHEQSEDAVFAIGHYSFKPASKMLIDEKGSKIRLTEKETSILKYLYRAGEKVVTRDVLLQEVWGHDSSDTTHTLETHIYRLRQKIEKDPSHAELLVTETGGYKLVP